MMSKTPDPFPRLKSRRSFILTILSVVFCVSRAHAMVLDFDDLDFGSIVTGTSYRGLTWEAGNLGLDSHEGEWFVPALAGGSYPNTKPHNLVNAYGSTLIGIGFPYPVSIAGSYIAIQGGGNTNAYEVRVHGYLNGTETTVTPLFTGISTTPAWFDMSVLINVDRIVFDASPAFEGQAYYGIDDLTFTYIPEPASMTMLTLASAGLFARRRSAGRRACEG